MANLSDLDSESRGKLRPTDLAKTRTSQILRDLGISKGSRPVLLASPVFGVRGKVLHSLGALVRKELHHDVTLCKAST